MKHWLYVIPAMLMIFLQATSCRWISSFIHDEEIIAEAAHRQLYRSDLDAVVPKGLSVEDSTFLATQYIISWASNCIYQDAAENYLSESEKDVEEELSDYRASLLKYRYEHRYVNERLDTLVTEQETEDYYHAHPEKFLLHSPVFRGRFLKISEDSPMLPLIRNKMSSSEVQDVIEADSLAYSSAHEFRTWNDEWVDFSVIAEKFGESEKTLLSSRNGKWIEMDDGMGLKSILYILDLRMPESLAPYEYCIPQIEDIIISNRKHDLLNSLEQDLLEEARNNGNFVIY